MKGGVICDVCIENLESVNVFEVVRAQFTVHCTTAFSNFHSSKWPADNECPSRMTSGSLSQVSGHEISVCSNLSNFEATLVSG